METEYWEITDYRDGLTSLFTGDKKIYSIKLSKKQVEEKLNVKLRICTKKLATIIVDAMVNVDGKKHYDRRKKRGMPVRYYNVK